jgi:hypothetical protein
MPNNLVPISFKKFSFHKLYLVLNRLVKRFGVFTRLILKPHRTILKKKSVLYKSVQFKCDLAGPIRPKPLYLKSKLCARRMVGLSVSSPRSASCLRIPVGYPLLSLPEKAENICEKRMNKKWRNERGGIAAFLLSIMTTYLPYIFEK